MGKNLSKEEQGQGHDHSNDDHHSNEKKIVVEKVNRTSPKKLNSQEESKEENQKQEELMSPLGDNSSPLKSRSKSCNTASPVITNSLGEIRETNISNDNGSIDITTHPVYQEHGEAVYKLHAFLENIYQCTFHKLSFEKNSDLRYLQNKENKAEEILLFTFENFEDVIQKMLESTLYFQSDEKLIFLHNIYTRLYNNFNNTLLPNDKKEEMMQISMSYITSYLISPEVFSSDITQEDAKNPIDYACVLYDMFYVQLTNTNKDNFIKDLIKSLNEDDYEAIISPILKRILRDCLESNADQLKKLTKATELLETILYIDKKVVEFFVNHYTYLPKCEVSQLNGVQLQKMTIFGACLTITTFPDESKVIRTHFSDKNNFKNSDEVVIQLRSKIHSVVNSIHKIMEYIMKCDSKYKRNILDWLYAGISVNDARQKTFNYGSMVSSDGWFTNFFLLLMKFSHKMLEDINKYPNWFEKIDFQFLKQKKVFNNVLLINGQTNLYLPSELTSNNSDKSESLSNIDSLDNKGTQEKYTFLSELVFITNHAMLLQVSTHKKFIEFLQKMQKQQNYAGPFSRAFLSLFAKKLGFDVQLADPYLLSHIYKLITFDILFILHTFDVPLKKIEDTNQIFQDIRLPKMEQLNQKNSLPIYWAENIQEYIMFLRQVNPTILIKEPKNFEITMNFLLLNISKESCIHNPHLKAKYLQILSSLVPQKESISPTREDDFIELFMKNEYLKSHLIKYLCQFFLEIDRTCSNSQFYENYSYKYGCGIIINYLLKKLFPNDKNSYIKKSLDDFALECPDEYLQFWTIALNDMISLLNEVLEKLHDIKVFQEETENHALWIFSFHDRHERTVNYEQNKKLIQTFSNFLNAYYNMLAHVSQVSPKFFLSEDIIEKLVVSLNYTVQQLSGRNHNKIKMKAMRILHFDPKNIIESVAQTYLQFKDSEEFLQTVVNDERSFDIELFGKILKTLKKHSLTPSEDLEKFSLLKEELAKKANEKSEEDKFIESIKDIPEEFIDPIMNHIMKDPVLLPTSNIVVDKTTILKHLAVDATDPFNRAQLNKEMLVPQEALKKKIEEFFIEKKQAKKEEAIQITKEA